MKRRKKGQDFSTYRPADDLLDGRVILITGAGDGIGRALSLAAARHGATLVLLGRTTKKLEAVYDEIVEAGGARPAICPLDLKTAEWPNHEQVAAGIQNDFGRLDGVVHNAGILGPRSPIEHYDVGAWDDVLRINLTAPFLLTRACLPLLRDSGDASVVFVSSGVGRVGRAYWGAYSVSKFGVEALSQILADETESSGNVRVNCVNPGATRTSMRAAAYPAEDPHTLPAPEDVVLPFLYLLGSDSRGVTGESLDAQ